MPLKPNRKNNHVLSRSLFTSLGMHVLAVLLLQHSSLWFSSQTSYGKEQNQWLSSMELSKKQEIVKEAVEPPSAKHLPSPISSVTTPSSVKWEVKPLEEAPTSFTSYLEDSSLIASATPPSPTPPPAENLNLFEHLPKNLIIPQATSSYPPLSTLPSALPTAELPLALPPPTTTHTDLTSPAIQPAALFTNSSWTAQVLPGKTTPFFPPPVLPKLPTLAELNTLSYADAFEADLVFLPREGQEGYFFALTLIPRGDLRLPSLRQHYSFLVDRSNSIQSERLFSTKNAIRRALDELNPDDTFNIIAFDSKIEKMSPAAMTVNPASLERVELFLESLKLGSFFATPDLYRALLLTVPASVKEDELHTALLFTDGETLNKKSNQRDILQEWTHYNQGKVSLFPIAVSSDARLATLDIAAMFNKGKLLFAPTHRGIKRKTLKAMKTIQNPVAKNLTTTAISLTPHTQVQLYPKITYLPHLYLNEPYIILGTCDTLDDFILFVQGRLKRKWLNIKKKVSFLNAKRGGQSLKSEWALQCAYEHYESYLIDGDAKHLAEVRELLIPHNLQVAFE